MSFISKTVRDRATSAKFRPQDTKDDSSRNFEKFRLFQILAVILNFIGNGQCR